MKLVVGLGNPGKKYERTRHNVGFEVIDKCQQQLNIELDQAKFKGAYGFTRVGADKIFLLKPLTYMNLSGESIVPLMNYFKMDPEDLLVVYDDLDLPPGKIRLRQKGSHGGHNGMRSIIQQLGTDQFNRIRIGIGRPDPGIAVPDYVLGSFPPEHRQRVDESLDKASNAVLAWTEKDFLKVMNDFNQ
ncbi:aminoacyl-tRNA hydrolase [Salipaludibacillus keqinensis]|uniref:Peptidyl-tRNA hydrolase n=1 Tax=Salipaludibacillus keqinensis TaxID=2045207 RepID=A0A323T504_9BACI|nr:aminoacyl-tRNA hydrolase [Salipaludibacillus keqinensis]PYZ91581.1 aminoacyl-tRNA hydrolase [Salipaludibacillus keqinensis]